MLASAKGENDVERVLDDWANGIREDQAFADWHYRTAFHASLGGQLMVLDVEAEADTGERVGPRGVPHLRDFSESFFGLPYEDALRYFLEREVMTPEEFYDLEDKFRAGGFTAARLTSEAMRTRAQQVIEQLLRGEYTIAEASALLLGEAIQDEADRGVMPTLGVTAADSAAVETIVRTNAATAYGQGRWQAMQSPTVQALRPYMQILCVNDGRTRANHRALDGKVFRIASPEAAYYSTPLGFNCFPGDVKVEGAIISGLRAWYAGQLVKLRTKAGRVLTVTPNHPLATPRGFVPAGAVRVGDDLLGYNGNIKRATEGDVDVEYGPSRIQDVFGALAERNGSVALRPRPDDLHGDARHVDGDVYVVGANRELLADIKAHGLERAGDGVLASTLAGLVEEVSHGALPPGLLTVHAASSGIPRSTALPFYGGTVGLERGPFEPLRIGLASALDAPLAEPAGDNRAADTKALRDLVFRFPGEVQPDQVVHIETFDFSGHVYDLQSLNGWIVASGIITSNCRCSSRTLSDSQLERFNAVLSEGRIDGGFPDDGFDGPPAPLSD